LPTNPQTENWVFGIVFMLFIFLVFSINRSYSWIVDAIKNITKVRTRSSIFSKTTVDEYQSRFLLTVFSVGVITLYLYLSINTSDTITLSKYLLLFLIGLFFLLIKEYVSKLIGYVFIDPELYKAGKENYYNTLSFLGFLLFPLLVLKIYFHDGMNVKIFDQTALILSVSALFFIIVKYFQIFFQKLLDFFHIMLYLCTLEILPLIIMYQLYKWIVKEF
ncbi:MAG: DUF4271 domain-containing protein, partial [Paludibacter sp.]|nr:DUF4271 domain-containing protein [Paludibacter sp.]